MDWLFQLCFVFLNNFICLLLQLFSFVKLKHHLWYQITIHSMLTHTHTHTWPLIQNTQSHGKKFSLWSTEDHQDTQAPQWDGCLVWGATERLRTSSATGIHTQASLAGATLATVTIILSSKNIHVPAYTKHCHRWCKWRLLWFTPKGKSKTTGSLSLFSILPK